MKGFFKYKARILVFIVLILCDQGGFAAVNKKVVQLLTRASQFLCST